MVGHLHSLDTATIAKALCVLREGSVQGAARALSVPSSSVGDAFERFESVMGMPLAQRSHGLLSLTLGGQALRAATAEILVSFESIRTGFLGSDGADALAVAARHNIPVLYLRGFVEVLQIGSIQKAAGNLGVSQPNLSKKMSRLERILGHALIERDVSGCSATERGLAFRSIAVSILAWLESHVLSVAEERSLRKKPLRFGTIIPLSHQGRLARRLAAIINQWGRSDEKRGLLISAMTAEDLIQGLENKVYDIVLLDTPLSAAKFNSVEVFSSELLLVGPRKFRSCPPDRLREAIGETHLAIPSRNSGMRAEIEKTLKIGADGLFDGTVERIEVDALSIILDLIVSYGFFSILTADSVRFIKGEVATFSFSHAPKLTFYLAWRRLSGLGDDVSFLASMLGGARG